MLNRVLEPCSLIRVLSWDARPSRPERAEHALGVAWPMAAGTEAVGTMPPAGGVAAQRERVEIICIGPSDWIVIGAGSGETSNEPNASAILQMLSEAFADSAFRATDVSSALARIQVEGAHASTLLSKACALDLHPDAFPQGRSARTRFAAMPVIVRHTQPSTFECIASRSFLDYLDSWLADASLEFEIT